MAHRLFAVVVLVAVLALAWRLWRERSGEARRAALLLVGVLALQMLSGVSNVLLDWPMAAALGHTTGAVALVALLVWLALRASPRGAAAHPATERILQQRQA